MKILTLNTHSIIEKEYEKKLLQFVEVVKQEKPDIIALQEVNQTIDTTICPSVLLKRYTRCAGYEGVICLDNHAARLSELFQKNELNYYWTWIPIKVGYGIYDEGIAIFSSQPILEAEQLVTSNTSDYKNWKCRKLLGIKTSHQEHSWFYVTHMGWWNDEDEPFKEQWDRIQKHLSSKQEPVWIMGDFNSPAQVRNEGYDYVKSFGWQDCYCLAREKDEGNTVEGEIDGWRDGDARKSGMRIDQVWSREAADVSKCYVVCNGKKYPVVSDHYGVVVIVEGDKENE